jgi:toxin ParE1/3/4
MEVRWSPSAANDLESICDRIERDNPEAARRIARSIWNACERLQDFPRLGRASIRMAGRRELVIPQSPYIVIYRVSDLAVEISHAFHGAQDWP